MIESKEYRNFSSYSHTMLLLLEFRKLVVLSRSLNKIRVIWDSLSINRIWVLMQFWVLDFKLCTLHSINATSFAIALVHTSWNFEKNKILIIHAQASQENEGAILLLRWSDKAKHSLYPGAESKSLLKTWKFALRRTSRNLFSNHKPLMISLKTLI